MFLGPVEHIRTLQQTCNKENVIIRKHISHYLILTDEQKKLSLKTCQGKLACHPGRGGGRYFYRSDGMRTGMVIACFSNLAFLLGSLTQMRKFSELFIFKREEAPKSAC